MTKSLYLMISCLLFLLFPPVASAQPIKSPLNLGQLVEEALQNNPEILSAKKRWEVFVERVPQASALEDPMLGFGIINLPTNFSFKEEDMTMKELFVSQKLPFPGKRPLMREMAEKEAEAVSVEIDDKANRIIKEVKTAYFDLSHVYRAREVTQRNKGILETLAKIADTRYSTGEGVQQDVLKAHVETSRMVDELIMLDQKKVALEAKLHSLLNRSEGGSMGEPEELIFRKFPLILEDLQKTALD